MSTSKTASRRAPARLGQVMAIPALMFVATIAGLVLGLTGDGLPDVLAWGLLFIPVILSVLAFMRRG